MTVSIVSERCYARYSDALRRCFSSVFALPADCLIAPEVADHPDMILSFVGDTVVLPSDYYMKNTALINEIARLRGKRIIKSDSPRSAVYPHDVGMNALVTSRHIFGKMSALAPEVVRSAGEAKLGVIDVKQGYAGCSSLSVGNVIVSGDKSVISSAKANGYGVIEISSDGIALVGYDHGFIGGASGSVGNTAYFIGNPDKTKGCESLTSELAKCGIKSVALSDETLTDFGGIKIINA